MEAGCPSGGRLTSPPPQEPRRTARKKLEMAWG
jgi:hypothetical protein